MNWKRYSFSRHYKVVTVEGNDPERLINICLIRKLNLKKIRILSETEIVFKVRYDDLEELKELAAGRYRLKENGEYGHIHRFTSFMKRKSLLAGLLLFAGIIIYQSLFISEIELLGYESLTEQALRRSMKEAGFYEGCRKNVNLDRIKLHLYEEFDIISWIGIKYNGNLAQVTIAEADYLYEKNRINKTKACNIVADTSGYITDIDPREGVRMVENGAYVKEGEVVISGEIPLERTGFEEDESENIAYVHAAGTVTAKVPVRLNYYIDSNRLTREKTGKRMITFTVNDTTLLREICPYEISDIRRIDLLNWVKPVRLKVQMNIIDEVKIQHNKMTRKDIKKQVLNEIHEYVEEKLPDKTQILNKSLNFRQEKNIIYIGVTLETLQEIGKEEEIIVDKSNRQSDQNDDQ